MGKSLLEVSYSSDYEVGWAKSHKWLRLLVSYSSDYEVGWGHLEVSYSSDYVVGWANDT